MPLAAASAAVAVEVGEHHARALGRQPLGDRLADARSGAGDEGDAPGQRARLGPTLELGLLEPPVLDAELLRLADRGVGGDRFGAAHHVDRVEIELRRHACRLLVGAVREHADAGHQHDRRVGAAHRRAVGFGVALVVGPIVLAVRRVQLAEAGDHVLQRGVARPVDDERADLGAQEVVGARRAEPGQAGERGAGEEVEHRRIVGEVAHLHPVGRRQAPQRRRQRGGAGASLGLRERLEPRHDRAERLGPPALGDERLGGADDLQRVRLALVARRAPRGDAVAAEDAPDGRRVVALHRGDVETELEPRAPPGHPHDAVAEALLGQRLAVGGGGEGDAGVGVEVVDVVELDQAVHRRVDRRGGTAASVQAVVERLDHLVFALDARVHADERTKSVEAQHGEPGRREGAEVAARSLHPEHVDGTSGDRIVGGALGRRVAAGVVGVPRVAPEPVRPRDQLLDDVTHASAEPRTRAARGVSTRSAAVAAVRRRRGVRGAVAPWCGGTGQLARRRQQLGAAQPLHELDRAE